MKLGLCLVVTAHLQFTAVSSLALK